MTWGKVDDKLWGHPKWMAATGPARGLWITALSWCMSQETDGFVPRHALVFLGGNTRHAAALVSAGLWEASDGGWRFHDWSEYQPDAASLKAKRQAESVGGQRGNHERWHAGRGVKVAGCEFCTSGTRSGTQSGGDRGTRIGGESSRTRTRKEGGSDSRTGGSPVVREGEPPQLETSVPRHILPAGWMPGNAHKAYAGERGIDLGHELHQFRAHCKSKRVTSLDWDAEFDKWLGNARSPRGGGAPAKRTTSDRVRTGLEIAAAFAQADGTNVVAFPQLTEGA